MNERLKQFIDYLNISTRKFEIKISASNGQIAKFLTKNTTIQSNILSKIFDTYPELSAEWLMRGKGEMLRENTPEREGERPNQSPEMLEIIKKQQETINNLIEMLQSERSAHPEPGPRMCKNA